MSNDDADDMCPNCVTPWKCNGPHLHEQTVAYRREREEAVTAPDLIDRKALKRLLNDAADIRLPDGRLAIQRDIAEALIDAAPAARRSDPEP